MSASAIAALLPADPAMAAMHLRKAAANLAYLKTKAAPHHALWSSLVTIELQVIRALELLVEPANAASGLQGGRQ